MNAESQEPTGVEPPLTYPARLNIDYVDGNRDRLTVFFRVLTAIPIFVLIAGFGGISMLIWPVLLMVVFRQKYPRWWFDFNLQLVRLSTRVGAYLGLLTDQYPSTDEEQGVHLDVDYPDASQLNRWLPLVKWLLAIPHYVVLFLLFAAAIVIVVVGWFIILFTGRFPRGFHDYLVGVTRWALRVEAYVLLLTTDEYPPFSLD